MILKRMPAGLWTTVFHCFCGKRYLVTSQLERCARGWGLSVCCQCWVLLSCCQLELLCVCRSSGSVAKCLNIRYLEILMMSMLTMLNHQMKMKMHRHHWRASDDYTLLYNCIQCWFLFVPVCLLNIAEINFSSLVDKLSQFSADNV